MVRVRLLILIVVVACRTGIPGGAPSESVSAYVTTGDQRRLLFPEDVPFSPDRAARGLPAIVIDEGTRYQTIAGWGAAMTDASAYVIQSRMNVSQREALLRELFGRDSGGIGLSFVRIPMGASDFSRSHYSYADVAPGETDASLSRFSIEVDRSEKIPVLKAALAINPELTLVGSPWSAPGWMKTSGSLIKGTLKTEFYPVFAEYLRRWIDAYEREGIPIFAVTLQNEPHHEPADYPGMRLDPSQRAAIIRDHVGPLFAKSGIRAQIWDWDHNWDEPQSPLAVLDDSGARRFVHAVAWHCYGGDVSAQTVVRNRYPDKDAWFTECSGGEWAPVFADNLKWNVSNIIIGTARGWARGAALWNLALDERGSPHLGGCGNCRGVVTINSVTGYVTRNVEYYALAHASRFVRPGAVRISSSSADSLENVAFRNDDDGSLALIVLNIGAGEKEFAVASRGRTFTYSLPAGAVVTLTWR